MWTYLFWDILLKYKLRIGGPSVCILYFNKNSILRNSRVLCSPNKNVLKNEIKSTNTEDFPNKFKLLWEWIQESNFLVTKFKNFTNYLGKCSVSIHLSFQNVMYKSLLTLF